MSNKIFINKSFLQSGKDLILSDSIRVKHPKIQEILDIDTDFNGFYSEELYYSWVSVFLCEPYNYMVYLDDKGIDYESIDNFDLFILLYKDMVSKYEEISVTNFDNNINEKFLHNYYFRAFKFFLNIDMFFIGTLDTGEKVLTNKERNTIYLNREMFNLTSDFIKQINGIQTGERINPEDEFAKKILIEDERDRLKKLAKSPPEEKDVSRLGNLLSAVTWACNGGITPFNRNQLHIYDLTDGVYRNDKVLNYNHTMTGLYSGCVDKDKINMQSISWLS